MKLELRDCYGFPVPPPVLYQLIRERPPYSRVSHKKMPSIKQHERFYSSCPFRYWLVIIKGKECIGAIECTNNNEIGISILREHQRKGYATAAIKLFFRNYKPLPAIPAIRNGSWLVNVAPDNLHAQVFFYTLGFRLIQYTMVKT